MRKQSQAECSATPMLNVYPDSFGGALSDVVRFLELDVTQGAFSSLYILPSVYNSDLDRGFSVISYDLNEELASEEDVQRIHGLGIDLKLDFLLNHASVLCGPFQDILANGDASPYRDFFIDWNSFWEGHGTMTTEGYIQPDEKYLKDMFFRKPGLPILMVRFPDGKSVPYWNTFYQEIRYPRVDAQDLMRLNGLQYQAAQVFAETVNKALDSGVQPKELPLGKWEKHRASITEYLEANRKYLGQMDLNIHSPLVWEYYDQTLRTLAGYGASIVRLDAFAYAPKATGKRNFLNEPDTWELLEKVRQLADQYNITLLPEIHASYGEKIYEKLSEAGYMCYDFFLPGLIIDAFERRNGESLCAWAREMQEKGIRAVNMLGCHDGIPLLDLDGILPAEQIERLIHVVVQRGGLVKDLHGQKNVYYQVNATYFSALGEEERRLLLARAIQLFMPGKPQVWYLDLFAGKNDYEAVERGDSAGHKEINRTNLSWETVEAGIKQQVVQDQLTLIHFRNTCPAFGFDSTLHMENHKPSKLRFVWDKDGYKAELTVDLQSHAFAVMAVDACGNQTFCFEQAQGSTEV